MRLLVAVVLNLGLAGCFQPVPPVPLVHDRKAWDSRWKQGEAVLLDHAVQGFRAMPAGGQCAACNPSDFNALIRFMAGREDPAR